MKQRLETKIAVIFLSITLIIFFCYFIAFKIVYEKNEYELMGDESLYTLQTMRTAGEALIDSANNYSKILLADEDIQRIMETGNLYENLKDQNKIRKKVYGLLQFDSNISSVYLVDKRRQIFSIGEKGNLFRTFQTYAAQDWIDAMEQKDSSYILSRDGAAFGDQRNGEQIFMIRPYRSLEDFSSLGYIAVNIDIDALRKIYREGINGENEQILLLNSENEVICAEGVNLLDDRNKRELIALLEKSEDGKITKNVYLNGKRYLAVGLKWPKQQWKTLRLVPMHMNQKSETILTINVMMVAISTICIFLGTIFVTRMITTPIENVLASIREAEKGKFVRVRKDAFFREFRYLFEGYNHLLDTIEQLLEQTKEEQARIRRIELNEIVEQMKPHFLYNTLGSIEALAMLQDYEKVCDIAEALGDFYRKSVSKGQNKITIQEELTIVNDYIRIIKIRFENLFTSQITAEDNCRSYMIPKLTLQPIVENAIHHGLRAREGGGILSIRVYQQGRCLCIEIEDNGVGFDQEILQHIREKEETYYKKSFGLRGTIERMKLMYGEDFEYKITSEPFISTKIKMWIREDALEVDTYGEVEGSLS